MNLQQFEYILAVSEETNFSLAAEKCCIGQSTLSTMILKFEEEIGIQIFDRKTKPIGITKEGTEIIEKIRAILKEVHDLKELSKEIKGDLSGILKVGVIPTVAPFLMPVFLKRFSNQYKEINLVIQELITENILYQVENRSLDIGIASSPNLGDYPNVINIPLYEEDFILFDYSDRIYTNPIDIDRLDKDRLWLLAEGHCMRTQIKDLCSSNQELKRWENLDYQAGGIDTLVRLVKQTQGLTLLPYLATLDLSKTDKEQLYPFENPVPKRQISLIIHKNFVKKGILEVFKTEIMNTIKPILN